VSALLSATLFGAAQADAATIVVPRGESLQAALDAAQPGDTILLEAGAEFVGNFVLPAKSGDEPITLRTSTWDALLPAPGDRIQPAHAPLLARLRSPNAAAALRTAPGAHHWTLAYLEFAGNLNGYGDVLQLGDGSDAQNTLDEVPHHLVLAHVYVHGDAQLGQKRCIALNAGDVTIRDSYVADCKAVGIDSQAIGGWNGPGPYHIENNYLEGAGENVLFGGADPAIPNLVADGIVFRRNFVTRPMAWRQPILPTPSGVAAAPEAGGTLAAGTYVYRVVARGPVGMGTTGRSTASAEAQATVLAAGGAVRLTWTPVPGATEYRVYGRTAGALKTMWKVSAPEFVDAGSGGASESVPASSGTVWSVKNLFELKNARNVTVEYNVFENHWKESQPGYAILFTPRNSGGDCTWCVIEHVRFEYNIVRNVSAGINLLGYDAASTPTRQTTDIAVRHNLFYDVTKGLGGNGWFMLVGDEPRDVIVEHNTIDHDGGNVVYAYGGTSADPREIYGFRMTANAARHGSYGIGGTFFSYGNAILDGYYPLHVFSANYLAGASTSRYPAGTLVAGSFAGHFEDEAAGNFALREDSPLRNAAPDGTDVGADVDLVLGGTAGVESGIDPVRPPAPVPPSVDFTAACTYLDCAFTDTSAAGSGTVATRAWDFGNGATADVADPAVTFAAGGTYDVTLTVTNSTGLTASMSKAVAVEPPNLAPVAAFTTSCADLACTFTDASTDSDGAVTGWSWTFGDGTTASTRSVTRAFAGTGTYEVHLTATDDDGASATAVGTARVTALLHVGDLEGAVKTWAKYGNHYWSAAVTIGVHGADERPIPGAAVQFAWTGAVVKTGRCVTDAAGRCTVPTGTLSWKRPTVTLTVTGVTAPDSAYVAAASHPASVTVVR
jgi:PKD repeat protein